MLTAKQEQNLLLALLGLGSWAYDDNLVAYLAEKASCSKSVASATYAKHLADGLVLHHHNGEVTYGCLDPFSSRVGALREEQLLRLLSEFGKIAEHRSQKIAGLERQLERKDAELRHYEELVVRAYQPLADLAAGLRRALRITTRRTLVPTQDQLKSAAIRRTLVRKLQDLNIALEEAESLRARAWSAYGPLQALAKEGQRLRRRSKKRPPR